MAMEFELIPLGTLVEESGYGVTRIGLMSAGVDVLNQFIGDQARIVIALIIVVVSDG